VCALLVPRQKQNKPDPGSDQGVRNMEIALEQFMENMETDNQQLVQLVTASREEARAHMESKDQKIVELEAKLAEMEQLLHRQETHKAELHKVEQHLVKAAPPIAASVIHEEQPQPAAPSSAIHTRYANLLEQYEQGKSIEAIAKKMGMNKGEVQLILQLAKQEEAARA